MFPRQRPAKVLALRMSLGCNAQSFHFEEHSPMHVKRRRLPNFESCSVALFASLAMGSTTLPARAQGGAPSARSVTSPATTVAARPTLRLARRNEPSVPAPPTSPIPAPLPDGSVSSPGFDEALK
jgi:hypothetical protein